MDESQNKQEIGKINEEKENNGQPVSPLPDHEKLVNPTFGEPINSEYVADSQKRPMPDFEQVESGDANHSFTTTKRIDSSQVTRTKSEKKSRKGIWKTIFTSVSSAIIGSLLTMGIFYYSGLPGTAEEPNSNSSGGVYEASGDKTYIPSVFENTSNGTIADIAEELAPSIVGVVKIQQVQQGFYQRNQNIESGYGSGVIFKKDENYAYIITNNHVIEGAHEVEVSLYDGERTKAEVVGTDALTDLAVLKIDAELADKVAPFGDSSLLRPGDEVIAIGNPLGLEFSRTVTQGIISAVDRNITVSTSAGEWELTVLQTDAAINPGNSGGALINSRGEVIGINSLKISKEGVEGLGFAIPSNDVVPIAQELIEHGEVKRPYLGVLLADLTDIAQFYRQSLFGSLTEGVVIAEVEAGSPADKAGLLAADVIISINGEKVATAAEFKQYLYKNVKPGDEITVEYYRDGKKHRTKVTTGGNE